MSGSKNLIDDGLMPPNMKRRRKLERVSPGAETKPGSVCLFKIPCSDHRQPILHKADLS